MDADHPKIGVKLACRSTGKGWEIALKGDLAGILSLASGTEKPAAGDRDGLSQVSLVAGAGFEPATFRL